MNEAGLVPLPESVRKMFNLAGAKDIELNVESDGVKLVLNTPGKESGLWFSPIVPPPDTPPILPEKISELLGAEGF